MEFCAKISNFNIRTKHPYKDQAITLLSIIMGMSLVITSANVTEIPYTEVLKIVVSAMFGFAVLLGHIGVACSLACSMSS